MNSSTGHLFRIEGQKPDGRWQELYQYSDGFRANAVLTHLISSEELPRDLEDYEDFRLLEPTEEAPPKRVAQKVRYQAEPRKTRRSHTRKRK